MKILTHTTHLKNLPKIMSEKEPVVGLMIIDELQVAYGNEQSLQQINVDYCKENNIPLICYYYVKGGPIISEKGNILFGYFYPLNLYGHSIIKEMLIDLAKYIYNKLDKQCNVVFKGNDLLINNFKVISTGVQSRYFDTEEWVFEQIQFNINTDIELIQNISKKTMEKQPKALIDYGFTTEEILNWIIDWLYNELGLDIEEFYSLK